MKKKKIIKQLRNITEKYEKSRVGDNTNFIIEGIYNIIKEDTEDDTKSIEKVWIDDDDDDEDDYGYTEEDYDDDDDDNDDDEDEYNNEDDTNSSKKVWINDPTMWTS